MPSFVLPFLISSCSVQTTCGIERRAKETRRELRPRANPERAVDAGQVPLDGLGADSEALAGLPVRVPVGDELGDRALMRGQPPRFVVAPAGPTLEPGETLLEPVEPAHQRLRPGARGVVAGGRRGH